ncbi:MAG: phosphatase PAP2 family protein, partial [Rhodanobacteraceae bacterium]
MKRGTQLMAWLRSLAFNGYLLAIMLVSGLLWGFIELAETVVGGETHGFDTHIILMLRNPADLSDPLGPAWVEELARDFTALGGIAILTFLVLAVAGFLWLRRQRRSAWFLLLSVATGIVLSQLLKSAFDRPRPDLVPHGSHVYTASFPSGHSMMAAIVYLTLAALLARTLSSWALKAYVMLLAIAAIVMVGISRVYLGVHWPTDVLAGWIVGAVWALACALVARVLELRGTIE